MKRLSSSCLALCFVAACASGSANPNTAPGTANGPNARQAGSRPSGQSAGEPKPYSEIITDSAVSDSGLFIVHQVDDKYYYEIPDSLFQRDMLLISRIARTPSNLSPFLNAGSKVGEQVVQWERRNDRVMLRKISYRSVADDTLPIFQSVISNNFAPILRAFDIEVINDDSSAVVIEVTDFFSSDVPAISGLSQAQRTRFKVRRLDGDRTYIEYARSYPLNLEVRHVLTFDATAPPSNANAGTISMEMNQSMVLLPKEPMTPRLADQRVGFFSVTQIDFGLDELKAASREYIRRWRLEPKDPAAYARGELVEPVKPIVYYLDPATPEQWRPYVKQGVEDWQVAFEAAGFRNAILARDPPSPEDDPDFNPEDVRYSAIRWVASLTRNAVGPSVSDPRSGEIIESDIIWYHNHMRSYRNRLMLETGAANPLARSLNQDEQLMGEAMRQVIAHEIGHALGLPHNMIASSSFPVDSLRSPTFTSRMGVAPTIMDYARQNYIAQPGDGVTRFIRKIGPYDHYAINWGYRVLPNATTPDDELPILDQWIMEHAGDPMYRYSSSGGFNPDAQTEDMGDDPVRASTYGIENLKRVTPNLIEWTSTPGEGYDDLQELYGELVSQWNRYVGHVVTLVGGIYENPKATDQPGAVFSAVSRDDQKNAVQFMIAQVFDTPTWLANQDILSRIEHAGAVDRIRRLQVTRLNSLLDPRRMQRLIETEVFSGADSYPLIELLDDVRVGIWSELAPGSAIDTYRRNLQRGYLERMEWLMTEDLPPSNFPGRTSVDVSQSDIRAFARDQLRTLRQDAERVGNRVGDRATRVHLADVVVRIDKILDEER